MDVDFFGIFNDHLHIVKSSNDPAYNALQTIGVEEVLMTILRIKGLPVYLLTDGLMAMMAWIEANHSSLSLCHTHKTLYFENVVVVVSLSVPTPPAPTSTSTSASVSVVPAPVLPSPTSAPAPAPTPEPVSVHIPPCGCRVARGYTSGWCGVAGGGVPACDH